ncbi:MAG: hypothetical protein V3V08_16125 [Nannocystaceae bacterium]
MGESQNSYLTLRLMMRTRKHAKGVAIPIEVHIRNNRRKPIRVPGYTLDELGNDSLRFGLLSQTTGEHQGTYGILDYIIRQSNSMMAAEVPQDSIVHHIVTLAGHETAKVILDLQDMTGPVAPGKYLLGVSFDSFHGELSDELEFEISERI